MSTGPPTFAPARVAGGADDHLHVREEGLGEGGPGGGHKGLPLERRGLQEVRREPGVLRQLLVHAAQPAPHLAQGCLGGFVGILEGPLLYALEHTAGHTQPA